MKSVDCNIIKDLLPSYIDKLLSKESNNLVENHMQTCKECRKVFMDMSQEKDIEKVFNQDEEIDYLKSYRKKKRLSIIIAVIITILVIFDIFIISSKFLLNNNFYMSVTDVEICYTGMGELNGNKTLCYEMTSDVTFLQPFCWDYDVIKDTENKTVYIKVVGIFKLSGNKSRSFCKAEIDGDTECVYLIDSKGNKIKIWNKEQGVLTKTHIYQDIQY